MTDNETTTADSTLLSNDERTWSILTHVGTLVLSVFPPLVIFLITQSENVKAHAREDLNLCISFFVYYMILFIVTAATAGIGGVIAGPLMIILGIMYVVMTIIAAVKASNNELFRYKMVFRLVK